MKKLVAWSSVGTGWHDGMAVDACGNVYVADYNITAIFRISPDGKDKKLIIAVSELLAIAIGAIVSGDKWKGRLVFYVGDNQKSFHLFLHKSSPKSRFFLRKKPEGYPKP